MGKRGKGLPLKVEANHNNNNCILKITDKRHKALKKTTRDPVSVQRIVLDSVTDKKIKTAKVIIEYKCKRLADEALLKLGSHSLVKKKVQKESSSTATVTVSQTLLEPVKRQLRSTLSISTALKNERKSTKTVKNDTAVKSVSDSHKKKKNSQQIASRELKSLIVKPDQVSSRSSKCRRKALTRALTRLRSKKPQKPKKSQAKPLVSSSPSNHRRLRNLNTKPLVKHKDKFTNNTNSCTLRSGTRNKMDYDFKDNDQERSSSPSVYSNDGSRTPGSKGKSRNKYKVNESDSDSEEMEMHVLEKQVESDKEEDDDGPSEVTLYQDDTDEESCLLSPSAFPASELFRSPSNRKKKRNLSGTISSISEKPKTEDVSSKSVFTSTSSYVSRVTPSTSSSLARSVSPLSSSSKGSRISEKRGRGRPRKTFQDEKNRSIKVNSTKKFTKRITQSSSKENSELQSQHSHYDFHDSDPGNIYPYSSSAGSFDRFGDDPISQHNMENYYGDMRNEYSTDPSDLENVHTRLERWKDRSTFVYAKHKFVSNENKFKCDTCQVSFTALSSLKRHYGTIYHKQQEASGKPTLDLTDILRPPDRDDNFEDRSSTPESAPSASSFTDSGSQKGRGRGRPPVARTGSIVRRNAVDNIKKYYAAADAARRRREHNLSSSPVSKGSGFTSTWIQKQQRKRKPLLHSDYLYPSASAGSDMDDDDDDLGCEDEENIENSCPEDGSDKTTTTREEETPKFTPWLSNVWKGIGPPHFTCEVCGERYIKKFEFTQHLFEHRQEEAIRLSLTCPDCQVYFSNASLLEHHFSLFKHGIGAVRDIDGRPSNDVKKFTCAKCNSKFARKDYYRQHLEVHKRPLLPCPHCPKMFTYKFYLNDHVKGKHDGLANIIPPNNGIVVTNNNNNNGSTSSTGGGVSVPVGGGFTTTNSTSSSSVTTSSSSTLNNNTPKPKIELYSASTTLFPSTSETNKRKTSNFFGGTCEPYQENGDNNDVSSDTAKKLPSSLQNKSLASTSTSAMLDIPVPTYSTCDPFVEQRDSLTLNNEAIPPKEVRRCGSLEVDFLSAYSPCSPPSAMSDESLMQKYLDSQKEQSPQDQENNESMISKAESDGTALNETNISNLGQFGELGHTSTNGSSKIVFQLENSLFKGLSGMEEDGMENPCSFSPLTIEIPRDKINARSAEEDEIDHHEGSLGISPSSIESTKEDTQQTPKRYSPTSRADEEPKVNTGNSSTLTPLSSGSQALGCGVKVNSVTVEPENELQCQDCGKIFEHKKSLIKHVRYYSQGESYPCTLCDKSFKLKHHVTRHIKSFHNIDTSSTTSSASDDMMLDDHGEADQLNSPSVTTSKGGSISFAESGLLVIPKSLHFSEDSHSQTCQTEEKKEYPASVASSTKRSLSISMDKSVLNPGRKRSASESSPKKLECSPSASSFSTSNYATVSDSSGATVFKCLICKKLYPSKNQIRSHLSYHKRTIPYKCNICNAEFKFKQDLTIHQQDIHDAEKPKFNCDKCPGKAYWSKKELMRHQREKHLQLGKKPVGQGDTSEDRQVSISICPFCPLVFPQESDLQKHISAEHKSKDILEFSEDTDLSVTPAKPVNSEAVKEIARRTPPFQASLDQLTEKIPEPNYPLEDRSQEQEPSSSDYELLEVN